MVEWNISYVNSISIFLVFLKIFEIFSSKCKNIERDFITIEIRDKGYHFFRSDWVGEVHLNISDYVDGKVHQQWYKLGEALVKKHISKPRGFIRIQTQLLDDPYQRPFATPPVEPILSFDEWVSFFSL